MKKIYKSPTIVVVKIEQQKMIAESLGFGDSISSASGAEVKDGGDWDIWGNGSDSDFDDEY